MIHFLIDLGKQYFQTHYAALSGLERLSVFSVHGTKSEEFQLCFRFDESCLSRTAEYLGKIQFLTLVHHIDEHIRIIVFHTPYDRCKVGRIVE